MYVLKLLYFSLNNDLFTDLIELITIYTFIKPIKEYYFNIKGKHINVTKYHAILG